MSDSTARTIYSVILKDIVIRRTKEGSFAASGEIEISFKQDEITRFPPRVTVVTAGIFAADMTIEGIRSALFGEASVLLKQAADLQPTLLLDHADRFDDGRWGASS